MGQIGILNVGAGDTKLTFDKNNPAEMIRSARIVTDMLRRGYALLIEIDDGKGGKVYTRAHEFREDTCEYIIADFDPTPAQTNQEEMNHERGDDVEPAAAAGDGAAAEGSEPEITIKKGRPKRKPLAIPASGVTGIAVSRSAGG